MRPKSLPEAAACAPSLCRRPPHATQVSAGGRRMRPKSLPEAAACEGTPPPEAAACKLNPCGSLASPLSDGA